MTCAKLSSMDSTSSDSSASSHKKEKIKSTVKQNSVAKNVRNKYTVTKPRGARTHQQARRQDKVFAPKGKEHKRERESVTSGQHASVTLQRDETVYAPIEQRVKRERDSDTSGRHCASGRRDLRNKLRVRWPHTQKQSERMPRAIACNYCKQSHPMYRCNAFRALSLDQRRFAVARLQLCRNCFIPIAKNHTCKGWACPICVSDTTNAGHNSLLCPKLNVN